jgi:uncharacterized Zn finger protein (UPF0148 family)
METGSPVQKCPKSSCDGSLVARPDGTVMCNVCGATFVNATAAELFRTQEQLTAIEEKSRLIGNLLRP